MEVVTLANGRHVQAIAIRSQGEQLSGQDLWDQLYGGKWPQKSYQSMAVLNREVPLGGLPSDVGVDMTNVATVTSVARAVMRRIPLTHRVVSVTGVGIVQPKNLLVPIGIPMGALIDFCGGLSKTAARMVAGGP
jgi:electron transport complex protein RnfC